MSVVLRNCSEIGPGGLVQIAKGKRSMGIDTLITLAVALLLLIYLTVALLRPEKF